MSDDKKQLTLIEAESDDALFLDTAEMRQKFTGTTVDRIETKRNYILALLAAGLPIDAIAIRTGSTHHTVTQLAAKYAQQIAQDTVTFAKALRATAARAMAIANGKLEGAKLGEVSIFMGVALQRANELEMAAAGVTDENIINMEEVNPALASARKYLEEKNKPMPETGEVK